METGTRASHVLKELENRVLRNPSHPYNRVDAAAFH